MSAANNGGPAFPGTEANGLNSGLPGMDLRDYFAAKAMQISMHEADDGDDMAGAAKHAYEMADAMLKARQA